MSLVPYGSREGREIVLRHRNAIVVRDPASQRLEIRDLNECPTCGQPVRPSSPDRQFDLPSRHDSYVDPDYFRLLGARHGHGHSQQDRAPSSPIRRLVHPILPNAQSDTLDEAEFVSSTPAVSEGSRIRREAFSPNYFKTFFVEEKELGRGGKGVVLLVRHQIDGCHLGHFACKRVPVGDDHAWLEKVLVEVELLAKLSHPNLVSYRHVWLEDVQLNRFGPRVACAFILQQYCNGGDLHRYVIGDQDREATKEELKARMRKRSRGQMEQPRDLQRRLSFEEIYSLFKDITSGLAYLHAANYIHRDLKPSNCLLHREGSSIGCLISDFGEVQPENMMRKSTGSTGTISYCAPEVLRMDATGRYGNFTAKSDVFSLGMILYFMCFGRLPYSSANAVHEELEDIDLLRAEITDWKGFQDERRERPDLPPKLYQLLKRLLALDPTNRPHAAEVLSAMKSESSLDGVTVLGRSSSPSLGLHGRRIQNLDSPLPPSTPVPDPRRSTKLAAPSPSDTEGTFFPANGDEFGKAGPSTTGRQPSPTSPRRRVQAAAVAAASRSQDGYTRRSRSRSRGLSQLDGSVADGEDSPHASTPLLLPPPTSLTGEVRRTIQAGWVNFCGRHAWAAEPAMVLFRLGLFLAKLATLTRPCLPYMISLKVGVPLVLLAGIDLGMPAAGPAGRGWLPSGARGDVSRDGALVATHMARAARVSLALFALHVVAVWVASRHGMLCGTNHDDSWANWS